MRSKDHFWFLGLEGLNQVLQFLIGIAIIRCLSKEEYSLYFLAFSVISITGPLTSTGLVGRFNRLAGSLVSDPAQFSNVLKTLLSLRQAIVSGLLPVLLILAFVLFQGQHVDYRRMAVMGVILIGYFYVSVAGTAYAQAARHTAKFNRLQLINLLGEVIRGVAVGVAAFLWPRAELFLIASAISAYVVYVRLRSFCRAEGFEGGHIVPAWRKDMLSAYWKLLPNSVFYVLQGQITIFVLGVAGTVAAVADLGAITRWGRVTQPLNTYLKMVFSPALSKCTTQASTWSYWWRWLIRMVTLSFVIVVVFWVCTPLLLEALGPKYSNLRREMYIYAVVIGIDLIVAYLVSANEARGFFSYSSRFQIPGLFVALTASVIFFDLTTLSGAILMGMSMRMVVLLLQTADWVAGMKENEPTPVHRI